MRQLMTDNNFMCGPSVPRLGTALIRICCGLVGAVAEGRWGMQKLLPDLFCVLWRSSQSIKKKKKAMLINNRDKCRKDLVIWKAWFWGVQHSISKTPCVTSIFASSHPSQKNHLKMMVAREGFYMNVTVPLSKQPAWENKIVRFDDNNIVDINYKAKCVRNTTLQPVL